MAELQKLRSQRWLANDDFRTFNHRSRIMQMGYDRKDWEGKPLVAILNSWSDYNPCHMHFRQRVEDVKRGVLQAGGFPLEMPTISLNDAIVKPSALLYRNMMAMEVEEMIRCYPVDAVVLMGGCDKTTPAMLLGATSANVPALFLPAGPMLRGNSRGTTLGSGSDAFKYWDDRRAGVITEPEWDGIISGIARSPGTCMTMGTASTMTAIAEALGMSLPGASAVPAVDAGHQRMSAHAGRRIVEMVHEDLRPSQIQTRNAFLNAITVAMAMGCSTNAIIHVIAMARRAGTDVGLQDFDRISRSVPVIANIRPNGTSQYLMEDFYYAGGLPALMNRLSPHLHLGERTVTGQTVGQNIEGAQVYNDDVIRSLDNCVYAEGSLAVLKGNLAPDGCVIKPSAMSDKFLQHSGPAVVFDDYPSLKKMIDDPEADITENHVIVLRNAGPKGGPGMPEWGMIPVPTKLLKLGVRDMLRISDARMSGTSYGACVLHVAPEAYVGGNLALVRTGDVISIDVPGRRIHLNVDDEELTRRRAEWSAPKQRFGRGYGWMFSEHILQADQGCDMDFLQTAFGESAGEPDIF
ncbi:MULTISPECIES: L-arabinonate dehydratase [Variovorax]|jgi:dihydroxy-acid dehydratase|uniref:L-arabinonate dehydratase n=1 Tax=Variovorax TaxID=34072 RepID=UPI000A97D77D|nr:MULTISPECIES: L-arabinonate dehydratase [Variovorax]MBN8758722.1 dihydroxy-acid dehydratase [Variovorax sp.]UKI07688.1 L-arabinonate dehydratase [Variovorax paradoxus]